MGFGSGNNLFVRLKWYGKITLFDSQKTNFGLPMFADTTTI